MKIWFLLSLLLVVSCGSLPLEQDGRAVTPFSDGFESGGLINWYREYQEAGYSVQVVTNPVPAEGQYCARFNLRPGDYYFEGCRSEIGVYNAGYYHTETWYGWSFLVPADYAESADWQVVGQFHDLPDFKAGENWAFFPRHSPPISLNIKDNYLAVVFSTPGNHTEAVTTNDLVRGVWHNVVMRIYWSDDSTGWQEFWLDGTPLYPAGGQVQRYYRQNMFNKKASYLKIGLYRSPDIATTNTVYYDDLRIGGSREAVWR